MTINVYFRQGTNADMAAVNVQNRVSKAQGLLPAEVTKIGVQTQKQQKSLLKVVALYSPDGSYDMQFVNNYMKINVEPRVKRIAANAFEYTIKYRGCFSTPEEFGDIVIRSLPGGELLRLKEVARIELGDGAYTYRAKTDGRPGCIAEAYQSAGSNATEVVQNIDALLEEISEDLPKGLALASLLSVNDFLFASIENVLWTLIEAIILVVLAIGTVVDNAIVVVEAVQAKFEAGYHSAYMATNEAMQGITAAIITATLVFMAVSMMGGTSGVFYTQFGITMAVAVGLSAVNALTLSPALCALLLRPYTDANGVERMNFAARFRKAFNAAFDVLIRRYVRGVIYFCRHRVLTWGILIASMVLLVVLMRTTKTGLVPDEDTGTVMVSINTKPGTSLSQTTQVLAQLEEEIQQMPQVNHYATVSGYSLSGSH